MTGNPDPRVEEKTVGGLLGTTAMYLINSNRLLLLGRSLGADKMQTITEHMRRDPVVEEVSPSRRASRAGRAAIRAEVEFSGKKIVERHLAKNKRRMGFIPNLTKRRFPGTWSPWMSGALRVEVIVQAC